MSEDWAGPAACVIAGLVLVVVGLVRSGGETLFEACGGCGDPMPDGYEASEGGKRFCRSCVRRLGLKPWYWKPGVGGDL